MSLSDNDRRRLVEFLSLLDRDTLRNILELHSHDEEHTIRYVMKHVNDFVKNGLIR